MSSTGRIDWVCDLGSLRINGLDTLIEGQDGGRVDADTLEFLAAALSAAGKGPVLIAMHHPPFASGIAFMDDIGLNGIPALASVPRQIAKSPAAIFMERWSEPSGVALR